MRIFSAIRKFLILKTCLECLFCLISNCLFILEFNQCSGIKGYKNQLCRLIQTVSTVMIKSCVYLNVLRIKIPSYQVACLFHPIYIYSCDVVFPSQDGSCLGTGKVRQYGNSNVMVKYLYHYCHVRDVHNSTRLISFHDVRRNKK